VVVQPRTVYVDRPLDTVVETYAVAEVYDQPVVQRPSLQTQPTSLPPADPITLLPSGEGPEEAELLAPLQHGDAAFAQGDYAEARRHYVRAQLDGPYVGEATLAYAFTRFAEGDYALAALAFRRGVATVPDAINRPIDALNFYGDANVLEAHLQALTTHLSGQPEDVYGWFVLGYVRLSSGDAAGALEAFDQAVVLDPPDQLLYLLRDAAQAQLHAPSPPQAGLQAAPPEAQPPAVRAPLQAAPPELL
jgi:tetratricopeptide (TPR) repeat protein